jgi:putative flavoprotein involved in K+ transport
VWLAGRDTGRSPRRILGRDVFDWTWPLMRRATIDTRLGRRLRDRMSGGGDALIGITECDLRSASVRRMARVQSERGGLPVCGDEVLEPAVIVWCTGFRPDYEWIGLPDALRADGHPAQQRGVSTTWHGLFFVGLRFQYRLSSSLIGGVGDDALFIAEQVASRATVNVGPVAR